MKKTLETLQNEIIQQLEGIKINVNSLCTLMFPHQLSGHLQTTSIPQADGAAFIRGNYGMFVV